jgi:hypothetical protein
VALFRTAPGKPVAYGYTIGMLCAEWDIPFVPGDLNNASTFDFPIRYLTVPGASGAQVLTGAAAGYADLFVQAAKQLEAEGVRAITGNCGYMAAYQPIVADAVNIPVFMSSLIQAPLLLTMLGSGRRLGVLVVNTAGITEPVLSGAGISEPDRLVFQGLDHRTHFNETIVQQVGLLDENRLRAEVVATALELTRSDPSIGAILLECSDLPPYARDIHRATGLPVFDWAGFVRYVHDATHPRGYTGWY